MHDIRYTFHIMNTISNFPNIQKKQKIKSFENSQEFDDKNWWEYNRESGIW